MSGAVVGSEQEDRARGLPAWFEGMVLAAVWLPLFRVLAPVWSASVEQAHGWFVPALAAYFWWERRRAAGAVGRPTRAGVLGWTALVGMAVVAAVAMTVLAANPLWPTAQWVAYGAAAGLTVGWLALEGGAAAIGRQWFPLCFVSTALSWPTAATVQLQAWLVGGITKVAAAVVSAVGFPAVVSGNRIEVATGFVGIDDACSGVRSLQAAWMLGWFFGELLGLRRWRRGWLVGLALATAAGCNLARTTTLTWLAAARGPAVSAQWHEVAGNVEMLAVLLAVVGWSAWLGRREPAVQRRVAEGSRRISRGLAFGVIAAGIGSAAVPEVWYGWHEWRQDGGKVQWRLQAPDATWRPVELPEQTKRFMRASREEGWERRDARDRGEVLALLVRWDGDATLAAFAEMHGPTVCLPAAGVAVEVSAVPQAVMVDGVTIEFQVGRFEAEGRGQHVLFCQWDAWLGRARLARPEAMDDIARWRWERVGAGRRHGDLAYLVFVVPEPDEAEARAWLGAWAPRLLLRD